MIDSENAMEIVQRFLQAAMSGKTEEIENLISDDFEITFTGGRKFSHPRQISEFNNIRYKSVQKKFESFDVCTSGTDLIVYSLGTLYGTWPEGDTFAGNRYIDRFTIRAGKITSIEVWNDSAEIMLDKLQSTRSHAI